MLKLPAEAERPQYLDIQLTCQAAAGRAGADLQLGLFLHSCQQLAVFMLEMLVVDGQSGC